MGDPLTWKNEAQKYELNYWRTKGIEDYSNESFFNKWWKLIFDWIGKIEGEVLDIGSGVRPPLKRGYVIEPLGKEYIKIAKPEWWDRIKLYSQPAEEFIPELENKFDFVLCWNSIDHGYNWRLIVDNVNRYLKKGGKFAVATDCKIKQAGAHPVLGSTKEEFKDYLQKYFKIIKSRENFADRGICLLLEKQ